MAASLHLPHGDTWFLIEQSKGMRGVGQASAALAHIKMKIIAQVHTYAGKHRPVNKSKKNSDGGLQHHGD